MNDKTSFGLFLAIPAVITLVVALIFGATVEQVLVAEVVVNAIWGIFWVYIYIKILFKRM